ncbi:MAG: 2-oxo acid dehydrogenase subunit E2 [Chloroflexi bacterium]|nr:2-oxo acid dehydrogenase subunit E2 [Chloroflexota bacterium]OJV88899.1 MAG: hypothetical protein BGO39_02655 [Chloroflexi bacterium 54-19]
MAIDVKMEGWADKSEADEAAVSAWFKKPGAPVRQGDLLAELIVEKVNLEVEAPADGILLEIKADVGQAVTPGAVLARLGTAEEWAILQSRQTAAFPPTPAPFPVAAGPVSQAAAPVAAQAPGQTVTLAEVVASPAAKRLLRENNLTLEEVAAFTGGTVRRIGEEEVKRYLGARAEAGASSPAAGAGAAPSEEGKLVPYSGLRRVIGDRMARSLREMAQLTISAEADITRLVDRREALKAEGTNLSYTALIAKAVALTLPRHPYLNAALEGDSIRLHSKLNLGIAVNLDEGLVVPVIPDAGSRSVAELAAEIQRVSDLARRHALTIENNSGGTFTITNLGTSGVDMFTPIINPPQVAILGVGRINERAGIIDGKIAICKMLWLSLSFDHRIADGAPAAAFLKDVRLQLESPGELFN